MALSDVLRRDNDFVVCDGDLLVLQDNGTSVVQAITERLQSFSNEWFLDAEGLPYLTDIWGKSVSYQVAYALLLETLADTEGVAYVESFDIVLDTETRAYTVNSTFRTIYDSAESIEICLDQRFSGNVLQDTENSNITDTTTDTIRDFT